MRILIAALLAMAVAAPALAQNDFELPKVTRPTVQDPAAAGAGTDFQKVLSGKTLPRSLALKDLNADWQRVTIRTTGSATEGSGDMLSRIMQAAMMSSSNRPGSRDDAMAAALGMSMLGGFLGGADTEPVYYTRGETVTVSGETFLVAYRSEKQMPSFLELAMQAQTSGKDPDLAKLVSASKLTPDSPVSLALINARSIASFGKIRPFNLDTEIAESGKSGGLMELMMLRASTTPTAQTQATAVPKAATPAAKSQRKPKAR